MPKPIAGPLAASALAAILAWPSRASAEIEYPWCAQYSEGREGGGTNCGFVTHEQCMVTISGIGGMCYENPRYVPAGPRLKRYIKPRH